MRSVGLERAQQSLDRLVEDTARSGKPVRIRAEKHSAVLVSEDQWRGIQETLYLMSIPGMHKSIKEGMRAALGESSEEPGW